MLGHFYAFFGDHPYPTILFFEKDPLNDGEGCVRVRSTYAGSVNSTIYGTSSRICVLAIIWMMAMTLA